MISKTLVATFLFACIAYSSTLPADAPSKPSKKPYTPEFLSKCKRSDPKLNECIIKLINELRPQLAKGIPRLQVPRLEPLTIPKLLINRNLENLKIKANAENVTIWGCSGFVINSLNVDPDKLKLKMALTLPKLYGEFKADFDGKVLNFPIKGKGKFSGNMTNTKCNVEGDGTLVKQKEGEFLQLKTIKIKATPGEMSNIKYKSTSNSRQDDALIQTARTFFKENRKQLERMVTPIAEETAVEIVSQIVNNILKTVPFEDILKQTA
ncbi:unnamed protein product [Bemisia tabaci]|uniref:Circadian clock-controlled protein n=1 Tax=Bemisia tabaci TaxID=7038 RepID=A0A9P0A9L7_BEMTA|nr:PREDICTED: uncharacterized protein LOC109038570 [Bemisia tabaci]CAH0385943.1 unnamed protein product [Bemisia tabaci]